MATPNEKSEKHIGQTQAVPNYVHDLVHDLSVRLDGVWRYDQCIANAESAGRKDEKKLWSDLRRADLKAIERLKTLLSEALAEG